MTQVRRRSVLGAGVAAAAAATVPSFAGATATAPPRNPLATDQQRRLDARALSIWQQHDFTEAITAARAAYLAGYRGAPTEEALARLDTSLAELAFGMLQEAVNNDPFRPRVAWVGSGPHRWLGATLPGSRWAFDNPDTIYRTIPIDPGSHYVITGRLRGSGTADLAFSLVNNLLTQTTVGYLDGHQLRGRHDPDYRVTVGPDPAHGRDNHIQTTDDCLQLFVRSTIADWATDRPDDLRVRRTGPPQQSPARTDDQVADEARQLIVSGAPIFGTILLGARTKSTPVNTLTAPGRTPGALVTQANAFGHFRLDDDQALVVTLDPARAGYATLPVTDPWMVGVDPGGVQSSLNNHQARKDADGKIRYVVARLDPGVPNWLATAGQREGTMMARWQRLRSDSVPTVSAEVVPVADLRDALPRRTPVVTPDQRAEADARRARDYLRRFRSS